MPSLLGQASRQVRFVWTHPANDSRRLRALGRSVSFQIKGRVLGRSTIGRVGQRGRVVARLHDNGSSQAIYANPSDYAEMNLWRHLLVPGDLFLDVGANIGLYSLWAADADAEVWAFEPDHEARVRLIENAELSQLPVRVFDCAIGAEPGELAFSVGLGTGNRLSLGDSSSGHTVVVRTIDQLLDGRRARGMKVDVEGAERLVVTGAAATLAAGRVDVVQLEWNHMCEVTLQEDRQPVLALMRDLGYAPFRPDPVSSRPVPVPDHVAVEYGADLFFASAAAAVGLGIPPHRTD